MKIYLIKVLIILLLSCKICFAQISNNIIDTVYTGNIFTTNFYNDINLAYLGSVLKYNKSLDKFGVTVSNNFLSNISKLDKNYLRDYNNFRFLIYYNLNRKLDAGLGFQKLVLSDDKNIETNKNKVDFYYTSLNFRPENNIFLNSKIGYKAENQIGEFNTGLSGTLSGTANNYNINEYFTDANAILFYENLIGKQNHNYSFDVSIYKRFSREADNRGTLKYYNLRNDFFTPATLSVINLYNVKNNIETRSEKFFYIGDNLNYTLSDNMNFTLLGSYMNREVYKEYKYKSSSANVLFENVYDIKVLEDNIELSAVLNYFQNKINTQLKFIYNERSENHSLLTLTGLTPAQILELENAEKSKNNNSRLNSLALNAEYFYSNTNSFGFDGSSSYLKYDTDFDQNYDDRDELQTVATIYHQYNNLLNFSIQTKFDLILSNLSYIYSQRSANNYKNKIYRLSSQSIFSPVKKITTNNFFQVLANYTVYDFEDIVSQVQSFSYRQLLVVDSTSYKFNNKLSLNFNGVLKYYEQGQFQNNNFSVKPVAYYLEQLYNPGLNYFITDFAQAGIGFKFFQQNRYQYENSVKQLANVYKSYGPVGQLNFYLNNNSLIKIIGGMNYINYGNSVLSSSSFYLQMNILWNI